jgi:hypothetical protein
MSSKDSPTVRLGLRSPNSFAGTTCVGQEEAARSWRLPFETVPGSGRRFQATALNGHKRPRPRRADTARLNVNSMRKEATGSPVR